MGVILKYQLEFPEVALKVSNDIFSGEFIIDSNITVEMKRNTAGTSFKIDLIDLPLEKAQAIRDRAVTLAHVNINLGYFDSPFGKVMEGVIEKVSSIVQADKLVTTIKGKETGTYTLENNLIDNTLAENSEISAALQSVLNDDEITVGEIDRTPQLENISGRLQQRTFRRRKVMKILDELADTAHAEFMVSDKKVWLGKPIKNDGSYQPTIFKRTVNLASFSPIDNRVAEEAGADILHPLPALQADGFRFTVIGDPKLRPGQRVSADTKGYDELEFRIHSVVHKFTMTAGYVCEGTAMRSYSDDTCRRRELSLGIPGAADFVGNLNRNADNAQRSNPLLEVGKVKTYTPGESTATEKHLGTLYFGQNFERNEIQPSINIVVESNEQRLFRNKPLVSPFAWHKCGLVVPVYPGMKAFLNHNLALQDDVLINGFIWSETPAITPPKNKAGDWWLCLPIDFDTENPPSDSTKAVNDLTANNGKRLIQLKGLKITVGTSTLPNVGERPEEGADDEFLIEHSSGTTLKIADDGKVTIEADNVEITGDVKITGDVTVEGNVEIK
jgi:hypothetical protein